MTTTQQSEEFVYYLNEPGSKYYYGTRHGSPFRSKPHAELQAKNTPYRVVTFKLVRVEEEVSKNFCGGYSEFPEQ